MPNRINYNDNKQIVSVDIELDGSHANEVKKQLEVAEEAKKEFVALLKKYGVTLNTFPMTLDHAEEFAKNVVAKEKDKRKAAAVADKLSLIGFRFQGAAIKVAEEGKNYLKSGSKPVDQLAQEAAVSINARLAELDQEVKGYEAEIAEIRKKIEAVAAKAAAEKEKLKKFRNIIASHAMECDEYKNAKEFCDQARAQAWSNFKPGQHDILWERRVEDFMRKKKLSLTGY